MKMNPIISILIKITPIIISMTQVICKMINNLLMHPQCHRVDLKISMMTTLLELIQQLTSKYRIHWFMQWVMIISNMQTSMNW
jgi:hypothetical protein